MDAQVPTTPTPYNPQIVPSNTICARLGLIADVQFCPTPTGYNHARTTKRSYMQTLGILDSAVQLFNTISDNTTQTVAVNPGIMFRDECVNTVNDTTSHLGICVRPYSSLEEKSELESIFKVQKTPQTSLQSPAPPIDSLAPDTKLPTGPSGLSSPSQRLDALDRYTFPRKAIDTVLQLGDLIDGKCATLPPQEMIYSSFSVAATDAGHAGQINSYSNILGTSITQPDGKTPQQVTPPSSSHTSAEEAHQTNEHTSSVWFQPAHPKSVEIAPPPALSKRVYRDIYALYLHNVASYIAFKLSDQPDADENALHCAPSASINKIIQQSRMPTPSPPIPVPKYMDQIRDQLQPTTFHSFIASLFPQLSRKSSVDRVSTDFASYLSDPPTYTSAVALTNIFQILSRSHSAHWHHLIGNHDLYNFPRCVLPYLYSPSGELHDTLIFHAIREYNSELETLCKSLNIDKYPATTQPGLDIAADELIHPSIREAHKQQEDQLDAQCRALQSCFLSICHQSDDFATQQQQQQQNTDVHSSSAHREFLLSVISQLESAVAPFLPQLPSHSVHAQPLSTSERPTAAPSLQPQDSFSYGHYYHAPISEDYHLIVLDAYADSVLGLPANHPSFQRSLEFLSTHNPNLHQPGVDYVESLPPDKRKKKSSGNWATNLTFNDKFCVPYNGFIASRQLMWLDHVLRHEIPSHRRVIVSSHVGILPEHGTGSTAIFDGSALMSVLAQHAPRVCMVVCGHDHSGHYAYNDTTKCHYLTLAAPIEADHGDVWRKTRAEQLHEESARVNIAYQQDYRRESRKMVYYGQDQTLVALNNGKHSSFWDSTKSHHLITAEEEEQEIPSKENPNPEAHPSFADEQDGHRPFNNQVIHTAGVLELYPHGAQLIGLGSAVSRYMAFAPWSGSSSKL